MTPACCNPRSSGREGFVAIMRNCSLQAHNQRNNQYPPFWNDEAMTILCWNNSFCKSIDGRFHNTAAYKIPPGRLTTVGTPKHLSFGANSYYMFRQIAFTRKLLVPKTVHPKQEN